MPSLPLPTPASALPGAARPATPAHPRPMILAHWATAALLVALFALALLHNTLDDQALRSAVLQLHRGLGLLAWTLAVLRLLLRTRWRMADTGAPVPALQRGVSLAVQALLYALLLGLPLLGVLLTNARGLPVALPGLGALPLLTGRDLDLADTLEAWHANAAWALAVLVALHLAAAVWHHRVRRDQVLVAMWPGLRPRA